MHKLLPLKNLFYLKLSNACTTTLKNMIASKTAIGPLNSFKDKIIIILTL